MTDNGPYETSEQVRHLPAVRAVYDAMHDSPRRGTGQEECEKLLTRACEEAGVTLGAYDARILRWLANWEPETCMVVAGLIARAAQRPEGTVTEWGVTLEGYGNEPFASVADESEARQVAASFPRSKTVVVRREVGPWTPAPGEEEGEDNG